MAAGPLWWEERSVWLITLVVRPLVFPMPHLYVFSLSLRLFFSSVPGHTHWAMTSDADICIWISTLNRYVLITCNYLYLPASWGIFTPFHGVIFHLPHVPFLLFLLSFIEPQILAWTVSAHCDHGSERLVMDKPLFDMKSMICKVDQITHKCIYQPRVIDFYGTGCRGGKEQKAIIIWELCNHF